MIPWYVGRAVLTVISATWGMEVEDTPFRPFMNSLSYGLGLCHELHPYHVWPEGPHP